MQDEVRLTTPEISTEGINKESVFRYIGCDPADPAYEEYSSEFEGVLSGVLGALRPKAALGFGILSDPMGSVLKPGTEVLCVLITLGSEISDTIEGFFQAGSFVKGFLADAVADTLLFSVEEQVLNTVREMCRERHLGIKDRFEAPDRIPMEMQKTAFDLLKADETLGMDITSGYMLSPVKSLCVIFETTDDESLMCLSHTCDQCGMKNCPQRKTGDKVPVTVHAGEETLYLQAEKGDNLLTLLNKNGIYTDMPCGGKGRCGKCEVRILGGRTGFPPGEGGIQLACRTEINEHMELMLLNESSNDIWAAASPSESGSHFLSPEAETGIAVDLGTTTLAFSLLDLKNKKVIATLTSANSQRVFGSDVITRIEAAISGRSADLKNLVTEDILRGITTLLNENGAKQKSLKCISISGNTTMIHLLMGYDVRGLSAYPFTPASLLYEELPFKELFPEESTCPEDLMNVPVSVIPPVSGFIGGDIVSGLYSLGFNESDRFSVLLDLGTNAEMAIGNREGITLASAAAGPAFEGGNIRWGSASIPGAISGVKIGKDGVRIKTIGDVLPALGICGTGVIETVSELLSAGLIDESGLLSSEYFDWGFPLTKTEDGRTILFTEEDIRELQLAKSAIRSGLEVLIKESGVKYEDIDTLFLSGGFGYYLDPGKAAAIGLIPEELVPKCAAAGNTSLSGAEKFLTNGRDPRDLSRITGICREIILAEDPRFNELYLKHMGF